MAKSSPPSGDPTRPGTLRPYQTAALEALDGLRSWIITRPKLVKHS